MQIDRAFNNGSHWLVYGVLFAIFLFFIPEKCHIGDEGHWIRWTAFMLEEGMVNIYDYGLIYPTEFTCNYPPVLLYIFRLYGFIVGDIDTLISSSKYFKVIPLVFDFIGAMSIFLLLKPKGNMRWLPVLLLFNPAYFYNGFLWGQLDSVVTAFAALALIFALRKQEVLAIVFFAIALNTKLQAIVFLPVFLLAMVPLITNWKKLGKGLITFIISQVVILSPFILTGNLSKWWSVMTNLVDQYTNVSLNAFNFWHLILPKNDALLTKDYFSFWWGWEYKTWGLLLFFIFSFFTLVPLFIKAVHFFLAQKEADHRYKELVFLAAAMSILCFFFFNTQMHERYSHPVILLTFLFGALSRNYWLYGLASVAYFLNLERVLQFFDIYHHTLIFEKPFVASLFLLTLVIGLFIIYRKYPPRKDFNEIFQRIKSRRH